MTQNGNIHQYLSQLALDKDPCSTCGNTTMMRCIRREMVPQRIISIAGQQGSEMTGKVVNSYGRCLACGRGEFHTMDETRRPKLMVEAEAWGSLLSLSVSKETLKGG